MDERAWTLSELLRVNINEIQKTIRKHTYYYNGKNYWVVMDDEKENNLINGWKWIGQLGNIHVYRQWVE